MQSAPSTVHFALFMFFAKVPFAPSTVRFALSIFLQKCCLHRPRCKLHIVIFCKGWFCYICCKKHAVQCNVFIHFVQQQHVQMCVVCGVCLKFLCVWMFVSCVCMMCVCYFWFVLYVGCANVGVEYLCGVCVCCVCVCCSCKLCSCFVMWTLWADVNVVGLPVLFHESTLWATNFIRWISHPWCDAIVAWINLCGTLRYSKEAQILFLLCVPVLKRLWLSTQQCCGGPLVVLFLISVTWRVPHWSLLRRSWIIHLLRIVWWKHWLVDKRPIGWIMMRCTTIIWLRCKGWSPTTSWRLSTMFLLWSSKWWCFCEFLVFKIWAA